MNVNFFDVKYQESPRCNSRFGICDDGEGTPAYTNVTDNTKWIAKVINDDKVSITFTPVDNKIIVYKPGTSDKESTCDGMLTFTDRLYLAELKEERTGWITGAKEQLENTIRLLYEHNERSMSSFRIKKAYVCNKKHPCFSIINNAEQKDFFMKTKFRIDIQAEIKIK
jgi:hypothetical protein